MMETLMLREMPRNSKLDPSFPNLSPCTQFRIAEYHNVVMTVHSYNLAVMAGQDLLWAVNPSRF